MRYTWGYMVRRPVSEHMSCHQRWASNFGTVGAQSVMSISAWASLPKFLLQPMEFQTLHKRIYGVLFQVRTYLCLVSSTKCLRNLSDPIIRVTRSLSLYSLSISCLANSHVQESKPCQHGAWMPCSYGHCWICKCSRQSMDCVVLHQGQQIWR